jgi:hypothetical protein
MLVAGRCLQLSAGLDDALERRRAHRLCLQTGGLYLFFTEMDFADSVAVFLVVGIGRLMSVTARRQRQQGRADA